METIRWKIFEAHVDFVNCSEITAEFRAILSGWHIEHVPFDASIVPYLTFRKDNGLYTWNAPWIPEGERHIDPTSETVMDAIGGFHYEFIDWFVDLHPALFCLHTACVQIGKAGVLFPCVQKAGKSTLCMQLVERGHRLFGDDVVCLSNDGMFARSLGLSPRLRLPLPTKVLSPSVIDFIQRRQGLSDQDWLYVKLPEDELAPLDETCPIGGIVVLERCDDAEATLEDIPRSQALKALIDQNFGRIHDPNAIFDSLRALALNVPCKILKFSRPEDAANLLEDHFAS